ncbi:MAG TPA: methyltransferase, partial [Paracoccaceae bacterium]|nr:methyltransferase [Paracoccaceae bacterium]
MSEAERLHLPFAQGLLEFPADGPVCFFRASPNPDIKSELGERLICLQSLRTTYDQLVNGGYAVAEAAPENVSLAFVQLTRSRPENLGTIAAAFDKLKTGGILVVNGAKTDGVDSLLKAVRKVTPVDGVLSKAHGKVFWFTKTGDLPEFAEWEKAASLAEIIPGFKTAPGMFSADKIDAGSARLAEHLSGELKGRVADLGAGWGWLAAQALSTPEITEIHLIEAEKTALDAA